VGFTKEDTEFTVLNKTLINRQDAKNAKNAKKPIVRYVLGFLGALAVQFQSPN
jgi:hypothetical protein